MESTGKIDLHTHYLPPAYLELLSKHRMETLDGGMKIPSWSPEQHLENMEKLSIEYAVLTVSSPHLHLGDAAEAIETARACNEYGAALAREYPERFAIGASLPLPEIEASIAEIRHCRETLGVRAFSLMTNFRGVYLGNPALDPVMEELNRETTLVLLHPTEPSVVPEGISERLPYPFMEFFFDTTRAVTNMILNEIPRRFPNLRFVIPHAGAFLPILSDRLVNAGKAFPAFGGIPFEEDFASFYYDLAGISMLKQYDVLRKITADSHLVYGSDGTFTPLPACKAMADAMEEKLSGEMKLRVYRENALKLLVECGMRTDVE